MQWWAAEMHTLTRRGIRVICVLIDPVSFGGYSQNGYFRQIVEATGALVYTISQDDNLTAALSFDARPTTRVI